MMSTHPDDEVYDPEIHPSQDILDPDAGPGHSVLDPDAGGHQHHPTSSELPGDSLGGLTNAESESRFD
ncbi:MULTISPECIES: hypothetical protein [unclassified Tessaracoccus]|uniref:hypothetical protein n=1 Tax=unclassified Tessaracoccus TaxID=2635419 RepID=UPI0015FF26AE|nr:MULTISPECIES: hypothetical protein [unclassified Tessaracoccus]MBB1513751.1 hypothetical protein [Tessaracoccus sp. MC1627]MBB1515636.1 hypothetical protein [Tessaracoccus sp. MC1679]